MTYVFENTGIETNVGLYMVGGMAYNYVEAGEGVGVNKNGGI